MIPKLPMEDSFVLPVSGCLSSDLKQFHERKIIPISKISRGGPAPGKWTDAEEALPLQEGYGIGFVLKKETEFR